ncbi:MAG: hypothetical protein CM15mV8_2080 [Caudoviricetes sp.]|nr:MAG: hypothetical protein CM15mV8_2080 [Caudoviricetes sp.]
MTSTTGQVIVDPSGNEDFVVNAETIVLKKQFTLTLINQYHLVKNVQGAMEDCRIW